MASNWLYYRPKVRVPDASKKKRPIFSASAFGAGKGLLIEKALLEKVGERILKSILGKTGLHPLLLFRERRRARQGVLAGQGSARSQGSKENVGFQTLCSCWCQSSCRDACESLKTVITLCSLPHGWADGMLEPPVQSSTFWRHFPKRMSGDLPVTDTAGPCLVFSGDPLYVGAMPFLCPVLPHRLWSCGSARLGCFVELHPCPPDTVTLFSAPGSVPAPTLMPCRPLGVSDGVSLVWGLTLRLVSRVCLARSPEHCVPFWVRCFWLLPLCIGAPALHVKMLVFYRHNPCENTLWLNIFQTFDHHSVSWHIG